MDLVLRNCWKKLLRVCAIAIRVIRCVEWIDLQTKYVHGSVAILLHLIFVSARYCLECFGNHSWAYQYAKPAALSVCVIRFASVPLRAVILLAISLPCVCALCVQLFWLTPCRVI